ncbi:MAG: extracellular solute-binding protein [Parcubacteria group bacterium]|nr:extracellular solute-binding protein [Parcubacteria group bacterium]
MSKLTPFQVILLGVFGFFIIFAVLVFSGIIPLFNNTPKGVGGEVLLWGTLPASFLNEQIEELNREARGAWSILYIQKRPETFDAELVEALASGRGPDAIFLSQDLILRHRDKVFPIPYENLSVRQFLDTFIQEGELYLSSQGVLALPFSIDPLVMYWNRDIFSAASISKPPEAWDEFFTLALDITKTDNARNIIQSTVALGEFENILHAKEILTLLILQAGSPIVSIGASGLSSVLDEISGESTPPAESALRFYTEFSNSAKSAYSWNRALPNSKDMFLAGDLAVYFGFASELSDIREKSPHLNFDVALVPQIRDSGVTMTFGNMTGLAVMKQSKNPGTALHVVSLMSGKDFIKKITEASALPPVRRDLLATVPVGITGGVFYRGALTSRAWLDPNPPVTNVIFARMVENTISGRERISAAITRASQEIGRLLPQQ